jgi:hypothetical protein
MIPYFREFLCVVLGALLTRQYTWDFMHTLYGAVTVLKKIELFLVSLSVVVLVYVFFIYMPMAKLASQLDTIRPMGRRSRRH